MDHSTQMPVDLNPEVVKVVSEFIGSITGCTPPPHDAFPAEWYGHLRTLTERLSEVERDHSRGEERQTSGHDMTAVDIQKPIYQLRLACGDWRDQAESSYRYNVQSPMNEVRIVYAATPGAAAIEKGLCSPGGEGEPQRACREGELFYLQESSSYAGNDVRWWPRIGEGGYTPDLSKARLFTKEEAQQQHAERETDIPWPKDYIDGKTQPAVSMQNLDKAEALCGTRIAISKSARYRPDTPKCEGCGRYIKDADRYSFNCPNCGTDNRP